MAERQVRLPEQTAQEIAAVIRAVLTDLGLDPSERRVREVLRFPLLEGCPEG